MHFWLHHGDQRFALPEGESVIGRSREADIVLRDKLVSRRHARLEVRENQVTVEDLSSGNGVFVNGSQITGATPIRPGDSLFVGRNRMELGVGSEPPAANPRRGPQVADDGISTRRQDALDLLGGIAEHALELGRLDQAEATLAAYLNHFLQNASTTGEIFGNPEKAAAYALRLAEATSKGDWIDYVFQLYTVLGRPLPDELIEKLERLLPKVQNANAAGLAQYVAALRAVEQRFAPVEQARLARLDELRRR
jgi:predicted component of type VI protein secretion system